ncbi:DNA-directed RNA polymerase I subunit RPA34, partial [Melozone crissalis]|uniref:DNA-directed RNA polymerase I subunit RPA34 n=1 Tax=Melozone crissalis TaxID=40204 RepID=UPI0023D9A88D
PPPRFRCPPEFEAVSGGVPMGGPQTELWLIRAPMDFCPQSLEGRPVPLNGLERLRPGDNDNNDNNDNSDSATPGATYVLRGGPAAAGWHCPLLLSPVSPGGSLGCAPPMKGTLSITRSFGTPRVAPGDTAGTAPPSGGTAPPLGTATPSEGTAPPSGTVTPLGTAPPSGGTATPSGTVTPLGTAPPLGTETEGPGPPEVTKRRKKRKKEKREGQE